MNHLPANTDPYVVQHPEGTRVMMYLGVIPTKQDRTRLAVHLASWGHLNSLLILNVFSLEELYKLLLYELLGARRQQVLLKLQSRIITHQRKHLNNIVHVLRSSSVPSVVRAKDVVLSSGVPSPGSGDKAPDRSHPRRNGASRAKGSRRKCQPVSPRIVYVPSE